MKWPMIPLKDIAPPSVSMTQLDPDDIVWRLNLDQIESNTGYIVNKQMALVSQAGSSTLIFDEDNVLYSKLRPYLNKVVRPREVGIATSELIPLRPKKNLLDADFLTYYLRSNAFLSFAKQCVAGVKMPRIIMAKFWEHRVPLPPISEQRRIVEILDQANALRKKRAEADAKADCILSAIFYRIFGDPAINPKKWKVINFGEIVAETRNGLYKHGDYYGRGTRIFKMFNIQAGELSLTRIDQVEVTQEEYDRYRLDPGDILLNRVNTPELVGKCAVITPDVGEAVFESKNIRVRLKTKMAHPDYAAYYFNTPYGHVVLCKGLKHAIGMATINNDDLRSAPIPLPPLGLQKKWGDIVHQIRQARKLRRNSHGKIESLFSNLLHRAFSSDLTAKWREKRLKELLIEMEQQVKNLDR